MDKYRVTKGGRMNREERRKTAKTLRNDTSVLASRAAIDLLQHSSEILKGMSGKNPSVIEVMGMATLILRDTHEAMTNSIKEEQGEQANTEASQTESKSE